MEEFVTNGIDGLPEIFQALINTAMQGERTKYIQAKGCQRSEVRKEHANVSRCVHFGPSDSRLNQAYLDASGVVTEMLGAYRAGAGHADILEAMKEGFARRGQPEGWMEHFPGGVTGYLLADCCCLSS